MGTSATAAATAQQHAAHQVTALWDVMQPQLSVMQALQCPTHALFHECRATRSTCSAENYSGAGQLLVEEMARNRGCDVSARFTMVQSLPCLPYQHAALSCCINDAASCINAHRSIARMATRCMNKSCQ